MARNLASFLALRSNVLQGILTNTSNIRPILMPPAAPSPSSEFSEGFDKLPCGLFLEQQGHHDEVHVLPVDLEGVALDAFGDEADPFIERDRVRIVFPHRQFDSRQPATARRIDRYPDQSPSDALSAKRRQQAHAEHADM